MLYTTDCILESAVLSVCSVQRALCACAAARSSPKDWPPLRFAMRRPAGLGLPRATCNPSDQCLCVKVNRPKVETRGCKSRIIFRHLFARVFIAGELETSGKTRGERRTGERGGGGRARGRGGQE